MSVTEIQIKNGTYYGFTKEEYDQLIAVRDDVRHMDNWTTLQAVAAGYVKASDSPAYEKLDTECDKLRSQVASLVELVQGYETWLKLGNEINALARCQDALLDGINDLRDHLGLDPSNGTLEEDEESPE